MTEMPTIVLLFLMYWVQELLVSFTLRFKDGGVFFKSVIPPLILEPYCPK